MLSTSTRFRLRTLLFFQQTVLISSIVACNTPIIVCLRLTASFFSHQLLRQLLRLLSHRLLRLTPPPRSHQLRLQRLHRLLVLLRLSVLRSLHLHHLLLLAQRHRHLLLRRAQLRVRLLQLTLWLKGRRQVYQNGRRFLLLGEKLAILLLLLSCLFLQRV